MTSEERAAIAANYSKEECLQAAKLYREIAERSSPGMKKVYLECALECDQIAAEYGTVNSTSPDTTEEGKRGE